MDALNNARNAIEALGSQERSQVETGVIATRRIEKLESVVDALKIQVTG